jgi:hypothetical protein
MDRARLRARPREDVMNEHQMFNTPQVGSQNVARDEESTLHQQNATLRQDNEDLRASALWWKTLYDEAQRRCAELENTLKANGNSRDDVQPMPSSRPARPPRADVSTRPL